MRTAVIMIACAGLVATAAETLAAPSAHAATGSVVISQTGSNWHVTLTWNGGNECKSVTLPSPTGTVIKGTELQVRNAFALEGFNASNCRRTTTGGVVGGGDFHVLRPYSPNDVKLLYPGVSQLYMSFRPTIT
ncbi:hypothetical protein ACFXPR_26250 [Nocardia tengchongensis]|uniref:hypothetical protein n=1 Tax=Nocardia tengchongensis TaxID=2055889 RepID=UPI0036D01595